ncbi:hypothetical protein SELMODRAFT_412822 [Selaginella moellendorffii]|uniref:Uncharacterized protein n=1 Tax=Selaginella moellendorffii TaxID=88036 RepID=D8RMF1_SELML|nr:hypothetical protein SELMODRAFT_412822 [Selaginella moellendorffii]
MGVWSSLLEVFAANEASKWHSQAREICSEGGSLGMQPCLMNFAFERWILGQQAPLGFALGMHWRRCSWRMRYLSTASKKRVFTTRFGEPLLYQIGGCSRRQEDACSSYCIESHHQRKWDDCRLVIFKPSNSIGIILKIIFGVRSYEFNHKFLKDVVSKICNTVRGVNRWCMILPPSLLPHWNGNNTLQQKRINISLHPLALNIAARQTNTGDSMPSTGSTTPDADGARTSANCPDASNPTEAANSEWRRCNTVMASEAGLRVPDCHKVQLLCGHLVLAPWDMWVYGEWEYFGCPGLQGIAIHKQAIAASDILVAISLIDMYSKSESMLNAEENGFQNMLLHGVL